MRRYIDADKLKDDLVYNRCFFPAIVESAIRNTPTADVVEVVRCKDCIHSHYDGRICHHGVGRGVSPDHYCACGERREDGT